MKLNQRNFDEEELIAACQSGKSWAQRKLYELHAPTMMSVCQRYVNDRDTACDLLQDGFVKVFTRMDTYAGTGSFEGWMRRIFVTTALEYLRQNKALTNIDNLDDHIYKADENDVGVLEKLSVDDLLRCIAGLSEGYRTVFNLYAIEGYSHAEIGDLLNITEATSRSQFMRARKQLQKTIISLNRI